MKKLSKHWTEGSTYLPNNLGDEIKENAIYRALIKIMTFSNYRDPVTNEPQKKQFSIRYLAKISQISKTSAAKALVDLTRRGYLKKVKESTCTDGAIYVINTKHITKVVHEEGDLLVAREVPNSGERVPLMAKKVSQYRERGHTKTSTRKENIKKRKHKEEEGNKLPDPPKKDAKHLEEKVKDYWNAKNSEEDKPLKDIRFITAKRKKAIRHLTKNILPNMKAWENYIDNVFLSPFLTGKEPSSSHPNWVATIDWCLKEETCVRALEGQYRSHNSDKLDDKLIEVFGKK